MGGWLSLVVVLSLAPLIAAQAPATTAPAPPATTQNVDPAKPAAPTEAVMTQLRKTVVYIQADCRSQNPDGSTLLTHSLGTGFLLSYRDPRFADVAFTYVVTNRHVVRPGIDKGTPCEVAGYFVRLNRKSPVDGHYWETLPAPSDVPWTFPTDSADDLAVIPASIDPAVYDFKSIPSDMLLSEDDMQKEQVVEGDRVVFAGLLVNFVGQVRSEPVVREGRIALIPHEPMPTSLRSLGSIYLADCHSIGGNSGSPMFVDLAGQRDNGLTAGFRYKLLGIIAGDVIEHEDFRLETQATYGGTVDGNSGLAVVVPSKILLALLQSDGLVAQRSVEFQKYQHQKSVPTTHNP